MPDDYFTKIHKRTQPVRDAFSKPSAPKAPAGPEAAKAPTAPKMVEVGKLQGESPEDWTYMRTAQERINRKLAPKSVMGKSTGSKR